MAIKRLQTGLMIDLHVLVQVDLMLYLHGFSLLCLLWLTTEKVSLILVVARLMSLATLALMLFSGRRLLWL